MLYVRPYRSDEPPRETEMPCLVCTLPVETCVCPPCPACKNHGGVMCYEDPQPTRERMGKNQRAQLRVDNERRHGMRLNALQVQARLATTYDRAAQKARELLHERDRIDELIATGIDPFSATREHDDPTDLPFSDKLSAYPSPWDIKLTWE